jgi:SAM-dependent methyltransferase
MSGALFCAAFAGFFRVMTIFNTNWELDTLEAHVAGVHFYHSFQFSNGCAVTGDWEISRSLDQYQFPGDLRNRRVLDIGPGSGYFAFHFESMGAQVTVLESHGYGDFDIYGSYKYTGTRGRLPDRFQRGAPIWFGPVSAGFWKVYDAVGSAVIWKNGRIYDAAAPLTGEGFDLVFVGSLLLHLRDPIGALRAVRNVCADLLIATIPTWTDEDENPIPMQRLPYTHIDRVSWWMPNRAALRHWFLAAGFRQVEFPGTVDMCPGTIIINADGVRMNSQAVEQVVHARI